MTNDAEEDKLRAEMARIACEALDWRWLFERTRTGHTLVPSPTEAIMPAIDALLPRIREHVATAVQTERERVEQERVRPLLPVEHMVYTVAKSQVGRGDNPPINTTAGLLMAIERLSGIDRQEADHG